MPRKRQPTQLLPTQSASEQIQRQKPKGNEPETGEPKAAGRRSEAAPSSSPAPPPNYTTHWEPSRVVPGAGSFAVRRGGRFWHGFRRAAAAFMAARQSRRIGRFRVGPDAFGALSRQVACRGNARRGSHRDRAAAVAGGRCPRLRVVAARGLPSDCAGRVAGGAALPPAPNSSGRVGALDRGRDARDESAAIPASSASSHWRGGRLARPAR